MFKRWVSRLILTYLRFMARLQLKKFAPDIVGITGSAGKTSTRNAVAAVLKDKYRLKVSYKANSESGIPLNILGIQPDDYSMNDWLRMMLLAPWKLLTNWEPYEKYVVEMGVDSPRPPKNMEYLLTIVQPRIAIFLNAMAVHSEAYDTLTMEKDLIKREEVIRQMVAKEKGKLIGSLPENGLAILNYDDPDVIAWKKKTKAAVMTFGSRKGAQIRFSDWQVTKRGTSYEFAVEGERGNVTFRGQALPKHLGMSLAAALCVAFDEDYSLDEALKLIQKGFTLPAGRSSLLEGSNGSMIIDSSYNASPQPTADMLKLMARYPAQRRLALLGDMRELGIEALAAHEKLVEMALTTCDMVYLVGPMMRVALKSIRNKHTTNNLDKVQLVANAVDVGKMLKKTLKKGDVVLVKGSQNTLYLEQAVELILRKKADVKRLCRRGRYWDKVRARAFTTS